MSDPAPHPQSAPIGQPVQFHACAACHQVVPETMMTQLNVPWVCLLCTEEAISEMDGKASPGYQMSSYVPDYAKWTVIVGIVGFVGYMGFRFWLIDGAADLRQRLNVTPAVVAQGKAPWAAKPSAEWPTLVTS